MIPRSYLPDYVDRGGEQVWRPPARARKVDLYGFVIPADQSAIDLLLERDLVHPSGGAVDYRCAHKHVVVTFGTIGRESSCDPVDSQRGYITESEVSVWCLVADVKARGRLLWYLPYIFTDSAVTVATGREIFGYPKQLGYFQNDYPARLGLKGGTTTVRSYAIDPFGPNVRASKREMLSVIRKPGNAGLPGGNELVEELSIFFPNGPSVNPGRLRGPGARPRGKITPANAAPPAPMPTVTPWIRGMLSAIEGRSLTGSPDDLIADMVRDPTLVFLKQFRDVACATKACYQAVVEAQLTVETDGARYDRLDPSMFELKVKSWDSDPIAEELGIPVDQSISPECAFRARFGFDIDLGTEVWRAST